MVPIDEAVKRFLVQNRYLEEHNQIDPKISLLENGLIDSVAIVNLINMLEEAYRIQIEDDDMMPENFDSLERIEAFVKDKLQ
jgi:acyl carrier protein